MTDRRLIAFFSQFAPLPVPLFGAQIRIDRLVRELLRDFDVAFVCQTPVDERTLIRSWDLASRLTRIVAVPRPEIPTQLDPQWGSPVRSATAALRYLIPRSRPALHDHLWSDELVSRARAMFRELSVDAVWASRPWMAGMARAAGGQRIIVDIDDFDGRIVLERLSRSPSYRRKPLHHMQAAHLQRHERFLSHRLDAVVVCKREDLDLLAPGGRARRHVVPNGVDVPTDISNDRRDPYSLLFVGALWYEPNAEALRRFIGEVLPELRRRIPAITLTVAGRGPIASGLDEYLSRPGVELHVSPESVTELYGRTSLCVAPLLTGGGTSIKVLESLAFGVPTIASPVAARGLGLTSGTHLTIADSPGDFVIACLELLTNREKAQALGSQGRAEVSRRFSWDIAGTAAREAVHDLFAAPTPR